MLAAQAQKGTPLLLFARYVPREAAEKLMQAGINFVDAAGNIHVKLGNRYERTLIGRKEAAKLKEHRTATPGKLQALFTLAAHTESADWTVRQFAAAAGTSKSSAAEARKQFLEEGSLVSTDQGYQMREEQPPLREQLLRGWEQTLRPRLSINRYRLPASSPDKAIEHLRRELEGTSVKWSLTGGPASYRLNRFYQGLDIPLFFEHFTPELAKKLKLLPDREGPVLVLKSFGDLPFWNTVESVQVAHPWLIYCELMHSRDPRAHEAGEELRTEYLPNG
jgi:hypothetical protein